MNKKFILRTNPHEDTTPVLSLASRSNPGIVLPDDGCLEVITTPCKIFCNVPNEINIGDLVYTIGMTLYDGDNKYFNMSLQLWDTPDGTRICRIGTGANVGEITAITETCVL
jgi:hypothetical protein